MKNNIIKSILAISALGGVSYWAFAQDAKSQMSNNNNNSIVQFASSNSLSNPSVDFTKAAEQSVKSVVHITTKSVVNYQNYWGGIQSVPQAGSGSGVIISQDGYIVTNNHVIQGAKEVKVTFNDRITKTAKVIGTDPSTDLAVLKIDGNNYPHIIFGNSDQVKLGQWVLAVGYPLNLDATVTAGIVSAKSRNIGINKRNSNAAIESFIQTDAAVNMGNSGGALVNTDGYLVGINSAIATPTGSYAGYSYAIPSNLVSKVVKDLIEHGEVLRGYLGAKLIDLNALDEASAEEAGLSYDEFINANGVVIADVVENSGAKSAGLKRGDIIVKVNDNDIVNASQLMEQVAMYQPNDKVNITYLRNGKTLNADVTLKSQSEISERRLASKNNSSYKPSEKADYFAEDYGIGLKELSVQEKQNLKLSKGVIVTEITPDSKLKRITDIKEGFVITQLNGRNIQSIQDVQQALGSKSKSLSITGTYPNTGGVYSYSFSGI